MVSLCTINVLQEYFLHGSLPTNGLKCSVDEVLFPPDEAPKSWLKEPPHVYSSGDVQRLQAARKLGQELESFAGLFRPTRSIF